jgi:uncharacterized protein involved in exopolysaccharide biosynthesis
VTIAVSQPRSAPTTVSTASYRALFENYSVASKAIETAGLTDGGTPMRPERFLRTVLIVQERANTNLLQIQIRLGDPDVAAGVANHVAEEALLLGLKLSQEDGTLLRDQLKSQRDEAWKDLEVAQKLLLDYQQANRIELLRTDVEALIRQQQTLLGIDVDLSSERARVVAATAEQDARSPKLSLERRIDQDPTVLEAARTQVGDDARVLLGLGLKTEELNPTYLRLDSEVALSRTRIAQLERQKQAILDAVEAERKSGMLAALYLKEMDLQRLEADRNLARTVYQDIAVRYEHADADATIGSAKLQITDPAMPIRTPISWSVWLWLALGATLGALVFPVFIVTHAAASAFSAAARNSH